MSEAPPDSSDGIPSWLKSILLMAAGALVAVVVMHQLGPHVPETAPPSAPPAPEAATPATSDPPTATPAENAPRAATDEPPDASVDAAPPRDARRSALRRPAPVICARDRAERINLVLPSRRCCLGAQRANAQVASILRDDLGVRCTMSLYCTSIDPACR